MALVDEYNPILWIRHRTVKGNYFITVDLDVLPRGDTRLESLGTIWTDEESFLHVGRHVPCQAPICCKGKVADLAGIGPHSFVRFDVILENAAGNEVPAKIKSLSLLQ